MQNVSLSFLNNDLVSDDEVDELFSQLPRFTPPANMVEQIMTAVSELPLPRKQASFLLAGFEYMQVNADPARLC